MVKRTLAILVDTGEFSSEVLKAFLKQDLLLLFVSESENGNKTIQKQLEGFSTVGEIEFISCQREGCWEADIIVMHRENKVSSHLTEKIKEVATQKIVLVISEDSQGSGKPDIENRLPNSRIVQIVSDIQQKEFSLSGKDDEAKWVVQKIFETAGYRKIDEK